MVEIGPEAQQQLGWGVGWGEGEGRGIELILPAWQSKKAMG
jgi:hypothetical protein